VSSVAAPTARPFRSDEVGTELVARTRARKRSRPEVQEQPLAVGLCVAFVVAATCAAVFLPSVRPFSLLAAAISVAAYAAVSRVTFEIGHGSVLPTQLVLVPMLFVLPPRVVPLVVATALLLGRAPDLMSGKRAFSHIPLTIADATHSLGPAIVLALADPSAHSWRAIPIYAGALVAQFGADFIPSMVFSRIALGVRFTEHARSMRVTFLVDTALAPVGLVVAFETGPRAWGVLLVLPLVGLLQVFARERQVRIDQALELSGAYRGTAILLGDVIEADDAYTGSHSRDVVVLALAVSDRLGLDPTARRRAEFAALLHDVGKVKIPAEIINKPGPLDDAERALMNTHTLVGQTMLDKIGGVLGDVGEVVRSCHERWDGGGYSDGLAGETIPFEARIVCTCDAWSAMTSDRAYRKALPLDAAAAELRACSGTHFDPQVVDALVAVLAI
jgi:HD-GYP domain-containing protein (c-di-GMP phosphodiesterase class II)